jgi:hypothetical protein
MSSIFGATTGVPSWLRQVAEVLFDDAPSWTAAEIPFTAVHDWHALALGPLVIQAGSRDGRPTDAHEAVRALHARAATGEPIAADVWRSALEPALRDVYRSAYPYADAYSTASAAARSFALSRDYSEAEATAYGESYAALNTDANVRVHADANALANASATATAFAAADADAYARTYPFAYVRACVLAYGNGDEAAVREARARLADGLGDSLARVGEFLS